MSREIKDIQSTLNDALSNWAGLADVPVVSTLGGKAEEKTIETHLNTKGIVLAVSPPFAIELKDKAKNRTLNQIKPVVLLRYNDTANLNTDDGGLNKNLLTILAETLKAIQAIDPTGQSFSIDEEGVRLAPSDDGTLLYQIPLSTPITL
jgi:hypothetical protein